MESNIFDEVTKAIATSTSRRQALRRIAGILGGTALAGLFPGLALADNSDCAHFCDSVFDPGPDRGKCKSDAAHHTGLCYTCGPASPGGTKPICCPQNPDGTCTSYSSATCCSGGQVCQNGACVTPCTPDGGSCTLDSECCTGICDSYSGTCGCEADGTHCHRDSDCCTGVCNEATTLCGCAPSGIVCLRNSDCCSGTCIPGIYNSTCA
jgi:hypothetical protein